MRGVKYGCWQKMKSVKARLMNCTSEVLLDVRLVCVRVVLTQL